MARAERPRGACPECGKDCAITEEGGVRHHFTEDPALQAGPDSRKCRGVGEPPADAAPDGRQLRFLCRVPSGPGGCGHQVHLTANFRARTHLTPQGEPCSEGSSAPPIAVGPNGYRADTADWTEADWDAALPKPGPRGEVLPAARPEDLLIEPDRDFDPRPVASPAQTRPVETVPGPDRIDPHAREADAAIAAVAGLQRDQDAAYEQSVRDGLEETRRRAQAAGDGKDPRLHQVFCQHEYSGHDVWDEQNGTEAQVSACVRCGLVEPDETDPATRIKALPVDERGPAVDVLFDETHSAPTDLGPETHPGKAADCTLPECCTHPRGFEYGDDNNGHSGSFCPVCGTGEPDPGPPDWRTPPDLLAKMPEDVRRVAETNPECWDCGHEVIPLVDQFGIVDGQIGVPVKIVWDCQARCESTRHGHLGRPCRPQLPAQARLADLDEGVLFIRHTLKPPLNQLVYRAGKPTMGPLTATVVTAGPHAGKTGSLTDLQEEITCTDLNGTPRPRRTPTASGTPQAPAGPGASTSPIPSPPARTTPRPTQGPSSTPTTTATAKSAASPSSRASSSGASAGQAPASTSTPTATRTGAVADAFSTAKQAVSEADRYDNYGRYKLKHPDDPKKNVKWTRATTFAKSVQDTYALSMWSQRMVLKGASLRKDIVAAVSTLEVKADKDRVNALVEDAKKAAGNKVAANKGTAVHAFTEDRDKALVGEPVKPREIPEEFVPTVDAYEATLRAFGLEPVPGLIEFTTAVKQYEVAGTSDRVYRVTRDITFKLNKRTITLYAGEYVIGDVKGLALTERIPTPTGWTTMGEVREGDTVFDAYGRPCTVTLKSRTKRIGTYIVRFDDGSSVTCDSEHIWWTSTGARAGEPTAKSIQEVIATLQDPRTGQKHHRVPVAGPLELPEADLPIDPYLLGCWLGDGHRRGGQITKTPDLFDILRSDGHDLGPAQTEKGNCETRTVRGLTTALRAAGLQGDKHIPAAYLRASVAQRTALLRGLMDTDGSWNRARRAATFSTVDKGLALQVEELLLSLGQRPNLATVQGTGFGRAVTSYPVSFTPVGLQPFRLPRKADQAAASDKPVTRSTRRVIVSVEPGPDVETACIGVDSPTHTYLAGDRMVPTHNTGADLSYGWAEIAIQLALYAQGLNTSGVWSWETLRWAKPVLPGNPDVLLKVRTDVGLVPHLPVDRETTGAPLATLYAVDLDAGWAASVLCAQMRSWRKERTLATPLEIADVAEPEAPTRGLGPEALAKDAQPPVSRTVVESRPVTLRDKAQAVTNREEASQVFQEATTAKVSRAELDSLVDIMQKKLASFVEKGA